MAQRRRLTHKMVNVWSGSPATQLPSVLPNFAAIGAIAAEHLLRRGFRRFAFLGIHAHRGTDATVGTFRETVRRGKCAFTSLVVSAHSDESDKAWQRFQSRLTAWMARWQPPIGVLVMHDTHCRYLADACMHMPLRIPEEVALIGIGNESLICNQPPPSLSSFDVDFERVGYEAAALLERLMNGAGPPKAPLLRVNEVAAHVGVSLRSLELHFHAALGRTMSEEISRLRIERAKRLLVESDVPIKEIARDSGFASANHFHRVFRPAEGVSPGEYRARHTLRWPS